MTSTAGRRPAFPNSAPLPGGLDRTGLTVRQYYKAQALRVLREDVWTSGAETPEVEAAAMASVCGMLADAMIAEDEEHANGQ